MLGSLFKLIASLMRMDERAWERHANPWSVWTRIASAPLLMLAIWSIHWIGWWAALPLGAFALWYWLNPRIFPPPASTRSWAARAVMGERVYILSTLHPISVYHRNAITLLSIGSAVGGLLMAAGLIATEPWGISGGLHRRGPVQAVVPRPAGLALRRHGARGAGISGVAALIARPPQDSEKVV